MLPDKRFYTHRRASTFVGLLGGLLVWFGVIIIYLMTRPVDRTLLEFPMLFLLLLVVFFGFILLMSVLRLLMFYRLSAKGLTIHTPPFGKKTIGYQEIQVAELVPPDETKSIFLEAIRQHHEVAETSDLSRYLSLIRHQTPEFRYFTLTPAILSSHSGAKDRIHPIAVGATAAMVKLHLADGGFLYLSPANPAAFIAHLKSRLEKSDHQ